MRHKKYLPFCCVERYCLEHVADIFMLSQPSYDKISV